MKPIRTNWPAGGELTLNFRDVRHDVTLTDVQAWALYVFFKNVANDFPEMPLENVERPSWMDSW